MGGPLTEDELVAFKRDGYHAARGLLSAEQCQAVRDRLWEGEDGPLKRDDPFSWVGPHDWKPTETEEANYIVKGPYAWRHRGIGNQEPLVSLVRNTGIWSIAEQLLGEGKLIEPTLGAPWRVDRGAGQQSERVRGVICNLPRPPPPHPDSVRRPVARGAHVDSQPFHCGVVALVGDCAPGGGGFTIFPRTHMRLFQADGRFGDVVASYNPPPKGSAGFVDELQPVYAQVQAQVKAEAPHLEFHGTAGDVLFWHSRMFHAQSANHSWPPQIRQAVIHDLALKVIDDPNRTLKHEALITDPWYEWSDELRAAGSGEWFVDTIPDVTQARL